MKKLILAATSAAALLGLAACSDTDTSTTQSGDPPAEEMPAEPVNPAVTLPPHAGEAESAEPASPAQSAPVPAQ